MLTEGLPFQESANGIMKSTPSASSRHLPYQGRLSAFFCLSLPFSAFICPSLKGYARDSRGRPVMGAPTASTLMFSVEAGYAVDVGAFGVAAFLAADPERAIRAGPFLEGPFMAAWAGIGRRLGVGPFLFSLDGLGVAARRVIAAAVEVAVFAVALDHGAAADGTDLDAGQVHDDFPGCRD